MRPSAGRKACNGGVVAAAAYLLATSTVFTKMELVRGQVASIGGGMNVGGVAGIASSVAGIGSPNGGKPIARASSNHWLDMILHLRDDKNLCLDIEGSATHDGANVQLYPCSAAGTNFHQRWDFDDDGSIVSLLHGKCLDAVQVSSNGANVQVWTCTGALNQKWEYTCLLYTSPSPRDRG